MTPRRPAQRRRPLGSLIAGGVAVALAITLAGLAGCPKTGAGVARPAPVEIHWPDAAPY